MSVALVVTCYERTYREVLRPGFFKEIEEQNRLVFEERVALINNVEDPDEAKLLAEELVSSGELTSYRFVTDLLRQAIEHSRIPPRYLRKRPYLLDYGLVMPHSVSSDWVLAWDAEARLSEPRDWITPMQSYLISNPRVLTGSPNWVPIKGHAGVEAEAAFIDGEYIVNWGFSDQLFLIRRNDFLSVDWTRFAFAAYARHAPHPYTFEYRMESYMRATGRLRATISELYYLISTTVSEGVLSRTGGRSWEVIRMKLLHRIDNRVLRRLPPRLGPRLVKTGSPGTVKARGDRGL